jgi:hypothetical protein
MTPQAPRSTIGQTTTTVDFVDAGRTFSCSVAPRRASESALWWWFRVSSDAGNRYAPFMAGSDDTPASVQARIVTYYDELLAARAAPSVPRWQRARPAAPAAASAPASAPATPG